MRYLAKFSHIADAFAFKGTEIGGDTAVFEVDNTSERLVEQRANGGDGKSSSFGLHYIRDCTCDLGVRYKPQEYGSLL